MLVSVILLYEDVVFKTLSDRYTNSRMVPFLTHSQSQSKFIFRKSSAKNEPTMVNQHFLLLLLLLLLFSFFLFLFFFFVVLFCLFLFCFFVVVFFTVKLDATNSFPSNTAEVRHIYIFSCKWATSWENLLLSYVNNIHAVWSAPLLFAAWIVTRFYSSKLYSSVRHIHCTLRKASYCIKVDWTFDFFLDPL